MDILKRSLAPISDEAWKEIETQAKQVFHTFLSARKFVDVDGPKGWDYAAVPSGRLEIPEDQKGNVKYGIRQVYPLIETRASFKLNIWELDNITRGTKDIDLKPMEQAAQSIAKFEENTIYYGLASPKIKGLKESSNHNQIQYPQKEDDLITTFAQGMNILKNSSVEGPYTLILSAGRWQNLASYAKGYPLRKQIEELIEGPIIVSQNVKEAFLVSERGGDFRLTLGNDLSIGYESHNNQEVQLYFTESFVFQVVNPAAVIVFE